MVPIPQITSADLADTVRTAEQLAEDIAARASDYDRHGAFPAEDFDALREAGLLAAPLPTAHGGLGLGTEPGATHALYCVLRAIGKGSLPVGRVYEGHVNALALIAEYGTEEQQARYARDARAGHLFGVWNTEIPSDGVKLEPQPDGHVAMQGAKTFASGVGHVTRAFANGALPDGGWQMIVVPMDEADVAEDPDWWQAEGMRASASGRADFTDVVLDADTLVGAPDVYTREPSFTGGAVRFAAVQLGGARALFDAAAAHLRMLERTGHPVQQIRMGEAAVALESGALWLRGAADLLEREDTKTEDKVAYALMARTAIERACLDVMERVDRAVGARGLLPPSPIERIGRDLRLYLRQPNPDGAIAEAGAHALAERRPALGADLVAGPDAEQESG